MSITAFNSLEYVSDSFYIKENSNLCAPELQALLDLVESRYGVDSDVITIENNESC